MNLKNWFSRRKQQHALNVEAQKQLDKLVEEALDSDYTVKDLLAGVTGTPEILNDTDLTNAKPGGVVTVEDWIFPDRGTNVADSVSIVTLDSGSIHIPLGNKEWAVMTRKDGKFFVSTPNDTFETKDFIEASIKLAEYYGVDTDEYNDSNGKT